MAHSPSAGRFAATVAYRVRVAPSGRIGLTYGRPEPASVAIVGAPAIESATRRSGAAGRKTFRTQYGAGGGDYGILTNGNQFTFINNWTRNNGTRGMQINGSGHSGSGNHTPDGNNSPAGVGFTSTPPTLPSFVTGASWSPYA